MDSGIPYEYIAFYIIDFDEEGVYEIITAGELIYYAEFWCTAKNHRHIWVVICIEEDDEINNL
jgi:hypothetical protein